IPPAGFRPDQPTPQVLAVVGTSLYLWVQTGSLGAAFLGTDGVERGRGVRETKTGGAPVAHRNAALLQQPACEAGTRRLPAGAPPSARGRTVNEKGGARPPCPNAAPVAYARRYHTPARPGLLLVSVPRREKETGGAAT